MRNIDGNSQSATKSPRKAYARPTLVKGPVLISVTSSDSAPVSGVQQTECWVARAAFGEADIRWMIFSAWLLEDAPTWFRSAYLRYGESIGRWLADHAHARAVVRAAMMPAIRRKVSI